MRSARYAWRLHTLCMHVQRVASLRQLTVQGICHTAWFACVHSGCAKHAGCHAAFTVLYIYMHGGLCNTCVPRCGCGVCTIVKGTCVCPSAMHVLTCHGALLLPCMVTGKVFVTPAGAAAQFLQQSQAERPEEAQAGSAGLLRDH